jgi:hypothetical protein
MANIGLTPLTKPAGGVTYTIHIPGPHVFISTGHP